MGRGVAVAVRCRHQRVGVSERRRGDTLTGLQIGYEHSFVHQVADFLAGFAKGEPVSPTFRDALETQQVCDAVLKSAKDGQWVEC